MNVDRSEDLPIKTGEDVVKVRQIVRSRTVDAGFSLVDQTKFITAASELARNTIDYGGGGQVTVEAVTSGIRKGVRLTFADKGPGIVDVKKALEDGFTTGGGLGLGLSGAKRLSNEFEVKSEPGVGTTVIITRWK